MPSAAAPLTVTSTSVTPSSSMSAQLSRLIGKPDGNRALIETCSHAFQGLSDRTKEQLQAADNSRPELSWEEVKDIVETSQIDRFYRLPSQYRLYLVYCSYIKRRYGSVGNYVLNLRLGWDSPEKLKPQGSGLFDHPEDWKVLYNDWPYQIDNRILHLVIWTKFALPDDPATGRLDKKTADAIEAHVRGLFPDHPRDKLVWFKNWANLKSIPSVEHFHVMLLDPAQEVVDKAVPYDSPPHGRIAHLLEDMRAAGLPV